MNALLIVAHAPLASALKAVASHAFPDCSVSVHAIDVGPEDSPEWLEGQLRRVLQPPGVSWLVLTDVFGATPANVVQRVIEGLCARHVAGVNVPMLWRAICYAERPLDELAQRAASGGREGVMPVNLVRPQNQPFEPNRHVAVDDNHQQ